jgi:hypothetical protein
MGPCSRAPSGQQSKVDCINRPDRLLPTNAITSNFSCNAGAIHRGCSTQSGSSLIRQRCQSRRSTLQINFACSAGVPSRRNAEKEGRSFFSTVRERLKTAMSWGAAGAPKRHPLAHMIGKPIVAVPKVRELEAPGPAPISAARRDPRHCERSAAGPSPGGHSCA